MCTPFPEPYKYNSPTVQHKAAHFSIHIYHTLYVNFFNNMQFTTTSFICTLFLAFFSMMSLVNALPVEFQQADVYSPLVLYPNASTIWKVGTIYNVTWDNSNAPKDITNSVGKIQLRKGGQTLPEVLAEGFDILSGIHEIQVPQVTPGSDYSIVLMGDSGNFSPEFEIEN